VTWFARLSDPYLLPLELLTIHTMKPTFNLSMYIALAVMLGQGCTQDELVQDTRSFATQESLSAELNQDDALRKTTQFSMMVNTPYVQFFFSIGNARNFVIDWGDKTNETVYLSEPEWGFFVRDHEYSNARPHKVTITGDLSEIKGLHISSYEASSATPWVIHPAQLPHLEAFSTDAPIRISNLDFTRNNKLSGLRLDNASVQNLRLPYEHWLVYVSLNGLGSGYDFDAIIESIYRNATANDIRKGVLRITNEGSSISSEGLVMADRLRWELEWIVDLDSNP
jgi:hypothetical protein